MPVLSLFVTLGKLPLPGFLGAQFPCLYWEVVDWHVLELCGSQRLLRGEGELLPLLGLHP